MALAIEEDMKEKERQLMEQMEVEELIQYEQLKRREEEVCVLSMVQIIWPMPLHPNLYEI